MQVSIVAEQLLRLLHHCGMPRTDVDLIHGSGRVVNELLMRAQPRSTLFTGSQRVAEKLALDLKGKVRGNSIRMGFDGGLLCVHCSCSQVVCGHVMQGAHKL
jgi:delta 1-pyrroline-5-carboxylate dehydrogenase